MDLIAKKECVTILKAKEITLLTANEFKILKKNYKSCKLQVIREDGNHKEEHLN